MRETNVPIFRQIADLVADSIVQGSLAEGEQAPSTNELAAFHQINPATARKGITILVEEGVLEKRRGLGMFVAKGAKELILARRRTAFGRQFIWPLVLEASKLGIDEASVCRLLAETFQSQNQRKRP